MSVKKVLFTFFLSVTGILIFSISAFAAEPVNYNIVTRDGEFPPYLSGSLVVPFLYGSDTPAFVEISLKEGFSQYVDHFYVCQYYSGGNSSYPYLYLVGHTFSSGTISDVINSVETYDSSGNSLSGSVSGAGGFNANQYIGLVRFLNNNNRTKPVMNSAVVYEGLGTNDLFDLSLDYSGGLPLVISGVSQTSIAFPEEPLVSYTFNGQVPPEINDNPTGSIIYGQADFDVEYDENGNITNIISNTFEFDISPFTESDGNNPDPWDNSTIDDYNDYSGDVQDSISDFKGQFAFSDVYGEDFDLTSFRGAMTFWKDRFDEVMDFNPVFPTLVTTSLALGLAAVILGRKLGVG